MMRKICLLLSVLAVAISCNLPNDFMNVALWDNVPVSKGFSGYDYCIREGNENYFHHYYRINAPGTWEIEITSKDDHPFAVVMNEYNIAGWNPSDIGYVYKNIKMEHTSTNYVDVIVKCSEKYLDKLNYTITARMK